MPSTRHAPRLTLVVIARNEAPLIGGCLESARTVVDAMIVLDTDERLAEGAEQLRAEVAKPADFIGVLPVNSGFDLAGQVETSTAWIPRLLPAGVRYQGRVHEQPVSEWPRVRLPVAIHHSGYRRAALAR
ncbi:MAG: hypothetical protein C1943_14265 [Halochromatium sp.]|nr:hypothetical protein [Halochromatium sp.]